MSSDNDLQAVITLATQLHAGKLDKCGRPYIGHLERVATRVRESGGTWVQEQAAWLHDCIEDTHATAEWLLAVGVPSSVVDIVVAMTHLKNESNEVYWARLRENAPGAILDKLCDIYDNLDPVRLCYLDTSTQRRLRLKYAAAMTALVI